jgi:hypothetical protein
MRSPVLLALLVLTLSASAQNNYKSFGVYTSFFNSGEEFQVPRLVGGPGASKVTSTFVAGVEYTWSLNKWLKLATALEYSDRNMRSVGTTYTVSSSSSLMFTQVVTEGKVQILSLPITFRLDFLRYFFLTSGGTFDFQLKNTALGNQSGIGATSGIGVKYDFKKKPVTIFLQPYYRFHNIIPFFHAGANDHLLAGGVRAGLSWRLR